MNVTRVARNSGDGRLLNEQRISHVPTVSIADNGYADVIVERNGLLCRIHCRMETLSVADVTSAK